MNALGLGLDSAVGPSIDILTGLEMHLKLDDASGTTPYDSATPARGVTLENGALWDTGRVNGGITLDGTNDRISFDSVITTGTTFSFCMWVKPSSSQVAAYGCLFGNAAGSQGIYYVKATGKVDFYYGGSHFSTNPLVADEWNHIAVVVDAGAVTQYLNGVANGTSSSATSTDIKYIGHDAVPQPLLGTVDEVRFYSIALTPEQVMAIKDYTEAPPTISAETQQFIDRLVTPPAWVMERAYATFIDGLVAEGLFDAFDGLWLHSVDRLSDSLTNIVAETPWSNRFEAGAGLSFTARSGWVTTNNADTLSSLWNPSTASGAKYTLNNASLLYWSALASNPGGNYKVIKGATGVGAFNDDISMPVEWSGETWSRINSGTETEYLYSGGGDGSGMFVGQRTASNVQQIWRNGVNLGGTPSAVNSTAIPNCWITTSPGSRCRAWGFGRSLTSGEQLALHGLLSDFIAATVGSTP